jgi:formate dehydrogenase maturation protein FdhE
MSATWPIATPPVAMKFTPLKSYQMENAKRGICPFCEVVSLEQKHTADMLKFMQCSRCTTVVALEKGP